MRKAIFLVFTLTLLTIPNSAHAGILGSKCSNSGATITNGGTKYVCKNSGGKLKWQKQPALTEAQKTKARGDCVISLIGMSGWTNDDLINASAICRKRIP
jgi:hypothetical protein